MRYAIVVFVLFLCTTFALLARADGIVPTPVFEDTFVNGLDPQKWVTLQAPAYTAGQPGGEEEYFTHDAVKPDANGLHIVAERKQTTDPKSGLTLNYTSGRVESRQTFLYGRVEFQAKLPSGPGFWPGLWLRTMETQPFNGEIDVIEGLGHIPGGFVSTLHVWDNGKHIKKYCMMAGADWLKNTSCKHATDALGAQLPDLSKDYHLYAIEWLPDHVTWYFDGKPYFTVSENIPKVPMRLIMSLSLGGVMDGPITEKTPFPATLDVKNVKVWPMAGK